MKKIFISLSMAAMAALAVSCNKENGGNPDEAHHGIPTEFSASSDDSVKSYIGGEDGQILWSSSDKMCVNGVESYGTAVSEDGTRISFKADDVQGPYCVLSPYMAPTGKGFDAAEKTMSFILAGTGSPQGHVNSGIPTYAAKAGIMAAYGEDSKNLKFKHLMVYLKITVTGGSDTDDISHIYVRRNSAENPNIAGVWKVDYSPADKGEPIGFTPVNQTALIMYSCKGGLAQGTPVVIGIPAVDYEEGLIVTVKDVNGHFQSYGISGANAKYASKRGHIINKTLAFSPQAGRIRNADDWNAFAEFVNNPPENDWDVYRWTGAGTGIVEIANDFEVEEGKTLAKINRLESGFTIDGKGHTITIKNAREDDTHPLALVGNLGGTIKNLALAGDVTIENKNYISAFADQMLEGGSMENCVNKMNITVNDAPSYIIFGGLVRLIEGGIMKDCINEGNLTANIDFSDKDKNLQVGGIAAQTMTSATGEIVLDGCINRGKITVNPVLPVAGAHALNYNSVGGIIAWLRHANASLVLKECVNEGDIEYASDGISDYAGTAMCCVGGIVGTGCVTNSTQLTVSGTAMKTTLEKCRNAGNIHNCFVNYSIMDENLNNQSSEEHKNDELNIKTNTKVYTGGIAGSLMGNATDYAKVIECESYGDIIPYDIAGEDSSSRPAYCQVTGGLIGLGGYVEISDTKVNCKIGNGVRPTAAHGGVIGFTMRPFKMTGSKIFTVGYWHRVKGYMSNRAMCFCVPAQYYTASMSPAPNISGSIISDCTIGMAMNTSTNTLDNGDDKSDCTVTLGLATKPTWNTDANCVSGQNYKTLAKDVTFTNVTYTGKTNPF